MNYETIISLALVTVIYSTFIGPGLKSLRTTLKEIFEFKYPEADPGTDNYDSEEIHRASTELKQKLNFYSDTYTEVKQSIRKFYGILAIVFLGQLVVYIRAEDFSLVGSIPTIVSLLIILILAATLKGYMVAPQDVASLPRLINKGAPEKAILAMHGAYLTANHQTANAINEHSGTVISLLSRLDLFGFTYITTIESTDGERLYYAGASTMSRHVPGKQLIRPDGTRTFESDIANVKLLPGNYNVRVIIVNSPFYGKYRPPETMFKIAVTDTKTQIDGQDKKPALEMFNPAGKYTFIVKPNRISSFGVNQEYSKERGIHSLLTSKPYTRAISKTKRPIVLVSHNGNIGRYEINKYSAKMNIISARLKRRMYGLLVFMKLRSELKNDILLTPKNC